MFLTPTVTSVGVRTRQLDEKRQIGFTARSIRRRPAAPLTSDSPIRSLRCTRSLPGRNMRKRSHFVLYSTQFLETNPFLEPILEGSACILDSTAWK
jgi:hypothetical protein